MDKRNGKHFPRTPDPIVGNDSHLPDEILLLAVDGELSAHDAAQVREHLEACWSCRVRRDEIDASIGRVVEFSNSMVRSHLPMSPASRAMFLANLRDKMGKDGRPSLWERFTGFFQMFAIASQRPLWIAAGALLCIVLLVVADFRSTQTVSASEVIRRSKESERALLISVPRPVVYQKVRIEFSGRSLSRKLYRVPDEQRRMESGDGSVAEVAGMMDSGSDTACGFADARECMKAVFEGARLNWDDPLSAESFQEWNAANPERVDEVGRPSNGFTSIRSTPPSGPVSEIVFTFRTRDFHPVSEKVRLHNAGEINIIEDEYEVFSLDAVDPSVFALNAPPQPQPEIPRVAAPAAPPLSPSPDQLQEAELRARMALHAAGADLGDQIDVKQGERSGVVVQGIANSPERKEEIEAELMGVDGVKAQLVTPQDAPDPSAEAELKPAEMAVVVDDQPMLEAALKEKFHDLGERKQFVDSALGASQSAMAHVWALRRLARRYAPEQIAQLTPASRQILELLIRDHVEAIREDVENESGLLHLILPESAGDGRLHGIEPLGSDWRQATEMLFRSLEKVQHDTSVLLAGSQSSQDVDATVQETRETVQTLKQQLPCLYDAVSGNFLVKYHGTDQ
jgi:putative zinc finger protein